MKYPPDQHLSIAQCVNLACTLEATAPKAGNVYPGKSFDDLDITDFLACAAVVAPILGDIKNCGLGKAVLNCVERSQEVSKSNANLGIILLIAPLAMARAHFAHPPSVTELCQQARVTLQSITPQDGEKVYEAIRFAQPGGMNSSEEMDVHTTVDVDLMDAMRFASSHDQIARQYATNFEDIFNVVVSSLEANVQKEATLLEAITCTQIDLLSKHHDTLVTRKCGVEIAEELRTRAADTQPNTSAASWISFDQWLRADGNRRNPGTTADLIAAGLFVMLACRHHCDTSF